MKTFDGMGYVEAIEMDQQLLPGRAMAAVVVEPGQPLIVFHPECPLLASLKGGDPIMEAFEKYKAAKQDERFALSSVCANCEAVLPTQEKGYRCEVCGEVIR